MSDDGLLLYGVDGANAAAGPITATWIQNLVSFDNAFADNNHTFTGFNVQNGLLVVGVNHTQTNRIFTSVTIDGNAMTEVASNDDGTDEQCALFTYPWTGGTTTASLFIQSSSTLGNVAAGAWVLDDTGATVGDTDSQQVVFDQDEIDAVVDIDANGVALVFGYQTTAAAANHVGTNCTVESAIIPLGGQSNVAAYAATSTVTGLASILTVRNPGDNGNWPYIAAAFDPS